MDWQYKREEQTFEEIPVGTYRVVIDSAIKKQSRNGNDMLEIKMRVSGQQRSLWYHIPFLADRPEITNRMLTQLFDSFGIPENEYFNLPAYTGKAGALVVKHDDDGRAKVSYFIKKEKQYDLPPFVGEMPAPQPKVDQDGFMNIPNAEGDDGLPF